MSRQLDQPVSAATHLLTVCSLVASGYTVAWLGSSVATRLASKSSLCCRTLTALLLDQNYINKKNQVIKAERRILKELGFCVHVKHPHKVCRSFIFIMEVYQFALQPVDAQLAVFYSLSLSNEVMEKWVTVTQIQGAGSAQSCNQC